LRTFVPFLLGVLVAFAAPAQAGAERITGADVAEIQAVIHRQIDAFKRDDAPGAFALVSPGVRRTFGTAERFLDVVRVAYHAVYRPAAVAFLEMRVLGQDVVQAVQVTDRAGTVWVAYYAMQRQADGSWKTSGCHLVPPVRSYPA
jgi:hypothetical protein